MKLRAYDGKQMHYPNDTAWQIGVNPYDQQRAVSIPEGNGYITTSHVMRYVAKVVHRPDNNTPYEDQELFEGDIVELRFRKGLRSWEEEEELTKIAKVTWCEDAGAFKLEWNYHKHQHHIYLMDPWTSIKVIGNIHDNPEIELSEGDLLGIIKL